MVTVSFTIKTLLCRVSQSVLWRNGKEWVHIQLPFALNSMHPTTGPTVWKKTCRTNTVWFIGRIIYQNSYTELLMNYLFTFDTGHCFSSQKEPASKFMQRIQHFYHATMLEPPLYSSRINTQWVVTNDVSKYINLLVRNNSHTQIKSA